MTEQPAPVCTGQEWEIHSGTGTSRMCVMSEPFRASFPGEPLTWCVAVQRGIFPEVVTCERLRDAGRVVAYPSGDTLELARTMRQHGSVEISAIHASALEEVPADQPHRNRADIKRLAPGR